MDYPIPRTPYGPKPRVQISFPGKGRAKQSMKDECDINKIMARFQVTGLIEFVNNREAQYGDVTGIDLRTSLATVARADEMFSELPSSVRKEFNNDPEEFFNFVQDPENRSEAIEMGLIKSDDRRAPEPRKARTRDSDRNKRASDTSPPTAVSTSE